MTTSEQLAPDGLKEPLPCPLCAGIFVQTSKRSWRHPYREEGEQDCALIFMNLVPDELPSWNSRPNTRASTAGVAVAWAYEFSENCTFYRHVSFEKPTRHDIQKVTPLYAHPSATPDTMREALVKARAVLGHILEEHGGFHIAGVSEAMARDAIAEISQALAASPWRDEPVTDSCGCMFCDLKLKPIKTLAGMQHYFGDSGPAPYVKCTKPLPSPSDTEGR